LGLSDVMNSLDRLGRFRSVRHGVHTCKKFGRDDRAPRFDKRVSTRQVIKGTAGSSPYQVATFRSGASSYLRWLASLDGKLPACQRVGKQGKAGNLPKRLFSRKGQDPTAPIQRLRDLSSVETRIDTIGRACHRCSLRPDRPGSAFPDLDKDVDMSDRCAALEKATDILLRMIHQPDCPLNDARLPVPDVYLFLADCQIHRHDIGRLCEVVRSNWPLIKRIDCGIGLGGRPHLDIQVAPFSRVDVVRAEHRDLTHWIYSEYPGARRMDLHFFPLLDPDRIRSSITIYDPADSGRC